MELPPELVKQLNIDSLSYTAVPIEMYFSETAKILATGTAFIYELDSKYYLITNWHCITGINPETGKPIGNMAGIPDILNFKLLLHTKPYIRWDTFTINLYNENNAEWLIHPTHHQKVDVIALELEPSDDFNGVFKPINSIKFDNFEPEIADDVFVLGYPYSLNGGGNFPIWKRGSIATEPDIDYDGLPKVFIDTASKQGMSGSPVIYRRNGVHTKTGKLDMNSIFGVVQGFLGVYSGRLTGKSELDAQLGIVWKKEVIDQIILGNTKDTKTFY